ncbi:MAG: histidine kinase [Planctomycetaceae bacterium]|nr:histidine kinase [Planctomycetaceae bacterium]
MPRNRIRELVGSLRFRLTLWNTATVLMMVLFTLWAVREGLRFSLRHEADEQLVEDADEVRLIFERFYPDMEPIQDELNLKAISHTHRGFYVRLFDENRELRWTSKNAPNYLFPEWVLNTIDKPLSYDDYRIIQMHPRKKQVPRWTIRVATSYKLLENEVGRLTELMIWVGVVVLIISPLGGYWLAGRATRPLKEIIETTSRLHPDELFQRLPLRGTRDELDKLSLTINGFLDRIAKYISDNREFTANAAHELRSPLTAIQSSIEVALNSERTADEYKDLICVTLDQCSDLRILVNQLLLLAESDAGTLHAVGEPFDLRQVVLRALDMFQGVAEVRSMTLHFECSEPVIVPGDSSRLRQVVNNLIDNAMKFSPDGTRVDVELYRDSDANEAVLRVRDRGMGVDEVDKPHLFDRFYRGDKARGREKFTKGTGLGLSICEAIITAHKGRIEVTNNPTGGSTFTVRLPA